MKMLNFSKISPPHHNTPNARLRAKQLCPKINGGCSEGQGSKAAEASQWCGGLRLHSEKGLAVILTTLIILTVLLAAVISLSLASLIEQKISRNFVLSSQAYYASESGIEDSLYRIIKGKNYLANNSLTIENSSATISISGSNSQKTIRSEGEKNNRFRNLLVTLSLGTESVSFYYGVQVGEGGLIMNNNSSVTGNIYSNGTIQGGNGATITGEAWVSGATNSLNSVIVGSHAHANTISNCQITGDAYYQNISGSTVGGISYPGSPNPDSEPLPVSAQNITDWKAQAEAGGVINNNYVLINFATASLGPVRINGNLTVDNGADLTITGTIYVTGTITVSNGAILRLGAVYGGLSGILLSDDFISVNNNAVFFTSGAGSYLMLLSTKTGDAIDVANNANTVIFYASAGNVTIANNATLKEVTAYRITLANNSQVIYEAGLASAKFTSGSGASWTVDSWQETQ
ncbi:pilus assembly PilX N-terminal domain-containing protein [Patescibacteria group bacterium]|nr:pilus assembly PilX N-terminal domain-containing protein [Patescibacteria group bacterium]